MRIAILAFVVLCASSDRASTQDLGSQQNVEAILNELRAIRSAIEALGRTNPRPNGERERVVFAVSGGNSMGRSDAPITMIEFSDLECPFCQTFANTTFAELKKKYIDAGIVRFVSRDLPLTQIHQQALQAARTVRCAGVQGKFWEARQALIRNRGKADAQTIAAVTDELKLDRGLLGGCLDARRFDEEIERDMAEAKRLGLQATPTFLIARTTDGEMEGYKIVGAQAFSVFESTIADLLAATPRGKQN